MNGLRHRNEKDQNEPILQNKITHSQKLFTDTLVHLTRWTNFFVILKKKLAH